MPMMCFNSYYVSLAGLRVKALAPLSEDISHNKGQASSIHAYYETCIKQHARATS